MRPCSPVIFDAVTLGIGSIVGHLLTAIELAFSGIDGMGVGFACFLVADGFPNNTVNPKTRNTLRTGIQPRAIPIVLGSNLKKSRKQMTIVWTTIQNKNSNSPRPISLCEEFWSTTIILFYRPVRRILDISPLWFPPQYKKGTQPSRVRHSRRISVSRFLYKRNN